MPLIRTAGLKNFALMIENDAFYFRLNVEIRRQARQSIDNLSQSLGANRGRFA